ncbi:MAG: iron chelate uptake ABC transporter family permease subunit, partial [Thermoguttaceae bacterium]
MTAPFLRVENLDYAPSKGAPLLLRGVSFALERGTRVALVGRNGAGKTTLLRCVARLVAAPPRAIFLDGRPVESYARSDLARRVAYLGQHSGAYGGATARQVVLLGRLPHLGPFSRLSAEDRSIADEALERVDALRFADRSLDSLSGGERRRVLLAAAFAQDPDLLILDEPTAFLDLPGRRAIDDAIARWRRDKERTVLETTHDLDALPERFDRVLALRGGELLYDGAPSRVAQPAFLDRLFDLPDPAPSPSTSRPRPDSLLCESSRQDFPRVSAPLTKAATFRRGALLFALLLLALLVLPLLGRIRYPLSTWLDYPGADAILSPRDLVFWHERVPKTCLAALVGAGLSLAGLLTQTLFRNPLATPYTLGVSSGAAFGAILAILSSGLLDALRAPETLLGAPRIVWCAALGAALSTALVYLLSRRAREPDRTLLAGVAVGFFFS